MSSEIQSSEIRSKLREFIEGTLAAKGETLGLSDSDSLFLSGRMNSIDAIETVIFLEESFGFDVEKAGFDQARIDSIDAIMLFLE